MRLLVVLVVLLLGSCVVHNGLVSDGTIPSPKKSPDHTVMVEVVNGYGLHAVNVDVLQFCGQNSQYGPMQPYNQILTPDQVEFVKGDISSCFAGPAKSVDVIYNENLYPETCRVAITQKPIGYKFALVPPTGAQTRCTLKVKDKYSAIFTFNFAIQRVTPPTK